MNGLSQAREIVIVGEHHIFQGKIRAKGSQHKSFVLSLTDLLSNPAKTQPDNNLVMSGSNLFYLADVVVYSISQDVFENRPSMLVPTDHVLFAFEIRPSSYQGDPNFKMQAKLEQPQKQRVHLGVGEYNFEGDVFSFIRKYNKPNLTFLAVSNAKIDYAKRIRFELTDQPFYAVNRNKITYVEFQ